MDNQIIAIIVFHFIAIFSTVGFNFILKNGYLAVIVAALVTTMTYQVIGYLVTGYLDPFIIFAIILSFIYAIGLSGALTGAFYFFRKKKKTS